VGPWRESKAYGSEYECWEWASAVADDALQWLPASLEASCSRLDVAFDFVVPDGFMSDDLAAWIKPWCESHQLSMGIAGQGSVNTHYVGSSRSDRRIRIYRRDLREVSEWIDRHPYRWAMGEGPQIWLRTLRVEVMLRREAADAVWQILQRDREAALAAARGHVREMTGLPLAECADVPQIKPERPTEGEQLVLAFLDQHGDVLEAMTRAGIDIQALARDRWSMSHPSRLRRSRLARRVKAFMAVSHDRVRRVLAQRFGVQLPA